jgi:hypothetical protein
VRLESAGRGGPLRRSGPACTKLGVKHKARHGAQSYVHARLLSLLIPAGCNRSAAASRASSSMRAARVCSQAWAVAAAHDGSGRNNFIHQWSNRDPVAKTRRRSTRGRCVKNLDMGRAAGAGHSNALLLPDV